MANEGSKNPGSAPGDCQGQCSSGATHLDGLCQPFSVGVPPQQFVRYLSYVPLPGLLTPLTMTDRSLQHFPVVYEERKLDLRIEACILLHHTQIWQLSRLSLGDLVAEISLAPNEELEVETYRMERTLVEQSREDSTQFESAREQSSTDREATSVAAVASKVNNWTSTESMDLSIGATVPIEMVEVKGSAGYKSSSSQQTQLTSSTDRRSEHVHEATAKASEKLTTQTKVVMRTVRESMSSTRNRRILRNLSSCDTLHLYAYEVQKHYTVATWPSAAVPALRLELQPMEFDVAFVAEHGAFLESSLVDTTYERRLSEAFEAASALVVRGGEEVGMGVLERLLFEDTDPDFAGDVPDLPPDTTSKAAIFDLSWPRRQDFDKLHLLFWKQHYDRIHDFGVKILQPAAAPAAVVAGTPTQPGWKDTADEVAKGVLPGAIYGGLKYLFGHPSSASTSANQKPASADAAATPFVQSGSVGSRRPSGDGSEGDSGMWEWTQTGASGLFLQWRYLYWLYRADKHDPAKHAGSGSSVAGKFWRTNRAELLQRYAAEVGKQFTGTARAVLSDYGETTQLARRLDAFVLLAETAFGPAGSLPSRSAETALSGLLAHLNANRGIYTERYLGWIDKHHGVDALVPVFNHVFSNVHAVSTYLPAPTGKDPPQRWYDVSGVRRIGRSLFVPLLRPVAGTDNYSGLRGPAEVMASMVADLVPTSGEVQNAMKVLAGTEHPLEVVQEPLVLPVAGQAAQAAQAASNRKPDLRLSKGFSEEGAGKSKVKVVVSEDFRALADGVHVVAGRGKC